MHAWRVVVHRTCRVRARHESKRRTWRARDVEALRHAAHPHGRSARSTAHEASPRAHVGRDEARDSDDARRTRPTTALRGAVRARICGARGAARARICGARGAARARICGARGARDAVPLAHAAPRERPKARGVSFARRVRGFVWASCVVVARALSLRRPRARRAMPSPRRACSRRCRPPARSPAGRRRCRPRSARPSSRRRPP